MADFKVPRGRRWTPQEARAVLDEIERRGIPVKRFAAEKGLGAERLYRWKRLLRRAGRSSSRPVRVVPRFAEVVVRPEERAVPIEIELPGGIALRLGGESRVEDVLAILSGLAGR